MLQEVEHFVNAIALLCCHRCFPQKLLSLTTIVKVLIKLQMYVFMVSLNVKDDL